MHPATMLLIAHRGASALAPENSLAAFRRALTDGCDGIESDVRMTADGALVLMHDDDVARTTSGRGRISEMTLAEVRALDVGDGSPVPSLEELLDIARGRTRLFLELKGSFGPDGFRSAEPVARAVLPLVRGIDDVTISSFDPSAVAEVRAIDPLMRTALGTLALFPPEHALAGAIEAGHQEVHVSDEAITAEFIARAHDARKKVLVFTVNDPERLRELRGFDVDGVFTDDPAAARAALL